MSFYFEYGPELRGQSLIMHGQIELPRRGNWFADLELDLGTLPDLQTTVRIRIFDLELMGRFKSGGNWHNRATARIVGGAGAIFTANGTAIGTAGDISTVLPPKFYQQVPLRIPVQDALTACGLTLDPSASPDILNSRLTTWTRTLGPASTALSLLLAPRGYFWRVQPTGMVGVFQEGKNYVQNVYKKDLDYQEMVYDQIQSRYTVAVNTRMVTYEKGFSDVDPECIYHEIDSSQLRTVVWFSP